MAKRPLVHPNRKEREQLMETALEQNDFDTIALLHKRFPQDHIDEHFYEIGMQKDSSRKWIRFANACFTQRINLSKSLQNRIKTDIDFAHASGARTCVHAQIARVRMPKRAHLAE